MFQLNSEASSLNGIDPQHRKKNKAKIIKTVQMLGPTRECGVQAGTGSPVRGCGVRVGHTALGPSTWRERGLPELVADVTAWGGDPPAVGALATGAASIVFPLLCCPGLGNLVLPLTYSLVLLEQSGTDMGQRPR